MRSNLEKKWDVYSDENVGSSVEQYVAQVNTLTLIRHLNLLIISGQKHRGAKLALLGGDASFEPKLLELKNQIAKRIDVISVLNSQYFNIISPMDLRALEGDWRLLEKSDCGGSIESCYELHNAFIESLLGLMWRMVSMIYLNHPSGSMAQASSEPSSALFFDKDQQTLLKITVRLMPELIETMAKLRGIATFVAVIGVCEDENQKRLAYLLQVLSNRKDQLADLSKSLGHTTLSALPAFAELFLHEHKLDQLQRVVRQEFMSNSEIKTGSQEIFDFVTSIVEVYYKAVEAGIDYFQHKIESVL